MNQSYFAKKRTERAAVETLVDAGKRAAAVFSGALEKLLGDLLMTGTRPQDITVTHNGLEVTISVSGEPVWKLKLEVSRADLKVVASGV